MSTENGVTVPPVKENAPRLERTEGHFLCGRMKLLLLFVVHRYYVHLATVSVGSSSGDRAALSVWGNDNTACRGDLPIFLSGQFESVGVNYFVRAGIRGWVSNERIVFTIELTGPLVMRGLAVGAGSIDRDLDGIPCGLVHDRTILGCSWT